jgi:hypothetical protein
MQFPTSGTPVNKAQEGKYLFFILIALGILGYIIDPFGLNSPIQPLSDHQETLPNPSPCQTQQSSGYLIEGGKLVIPTPSTEDIFQNPCSTGSSLTQLLSGSYQQQILTPDQTTEKWQTIIQQVGQTTLYSTLQADPAFGPGLAQDIQPSGTATQIGANAILFNLLVTKDNADQLAYLALFQNSANTWQLMEVKKQ